MNGEPETSTFRQACIAAITSRAARNPELRPALVGWLDAAPYNERPDADLLSFADAMGVPADRRAEIEALDRYRFPDYERRVFCPLCLDTMSVDQGDGRFTRCPMCNPEPCDMEDV